MKIDNIKLLILDFDGTLGDTRPNIIATTHATLRELNLPSVSDEDIAATIGLPLVKCFQTFLNLSTQQAEECAATYRRIVEEIKDTLHIPAFPHVVDTLARLHERGLSISIASSRSHESLVGLVEELGIAPYVSLILGADDVKLSKPNPEPVLRSLNHYRMEAANALVVGDTHFDILMGRNAHAYTCGVTYGNGTAEELLSAGADTVIDRFDQLLNII